MSFFGVELNAQVNRLILEIRLHLSKNKLSPNFRTLYRSFVSFDPQVTGLIQPTNFEKAFNQNGIFFKKYEIQVFQKAYKNQEGAVNWFHFMGHLRQPMSPLRRQLIEHIFDEIDVNKKGKLTPEELMSRFNFKEIESFKLGKKSKEMIQNQFLSLFSMPENFITRQQFIAYYDDVNINFAHNDVFKRFVSVLWHHTEEKIQVAKEEQIKSVVKALRFKLIQKSQGTKDQFLLKKLFNEYDVNGNGYLSAYELDLMLKKLELPVQPKIVEPLLVKLDKNQSGYIEYDQYKKFLFFDPYPL